MTDKQLIKEEIERMKEHTAKCGYPGQGEFENGNREGRNYVCDKLLSFIDSLPEEPASEDLEEYYKKEFLPNEWFAKSGQRTISQFNFFTAKHFAEWQKQQMMKDALDGCVSLIVKSDTSSRNLFISTPQLYKELQKYKDGDKLKIIIVNED